MFHLESSVRCIWLTNCRKKFVSVTLWIRKLSMSRLYSDSSSLMKESQQKRNCHWSCNAGCWNSVWYTATLHMLCEELLKVHPCSMLMARRPDLTQCLRCVLIHENSKLWSIIRKSVLI